jgi:glycerol-3-phosphate acyltransferase PlsX
MGGDRAPEEIVLGAMLANLEGTARIALVGNHDVIAPLLVGDGAKDIEIVHADSHVPMDAHGASAAREADTSMAVAIDRVKNGLADAVVSAGNSGAFLTAATLRLGRIPGIARPAIAAVLPGRNGPWVLCDAGANVDCRPEWLAQFGIMGSAYAHGVLGIDEPRVGIISVGEEKTKGNAQTLEAAALLARAPIKFIGNVEGNDCFGDTVDVVVTDGFVGNVMLKLAEGAASYFSGVIRETLYTSGPLPAVGAILAKPAFDRIRGRLSYERYGGAPLLGVRGTCIVSHGRSSGEAIRNAVGAAARATRTDIVGTIGRRVAQAAA